MWKCFTLPASSRSLTRIVIAITAVFSTACGGGTSDHGYGPSTSLAGGQVLRPAFLGQTGEKKVGQYVWVWRSKKIQVDKSAEIEATCPTDYVVLGGGYKIAANGGYYGHPTASSRPSETFDGWVVDTDGGAYAIVTVTVYGSCAPEK
jgi:hypothetical protein